MALSPIARTLFGQAAVDEQNKLLTDGTVKANPVLFGGAKVTNRDVGGGFRGIQYGPGGVEVISKGYGGTNPALQAIQQLRDTGFTPEQATNATTGASLANVNETKATLMPAESAANVANTNASTGLIRNQASVVVPTAMAGIGLTNAQAASVGVDTGIRKREGLDVVNTSLNSLLSQLPANLRPYYRLSDDGTQLVPKTVLSR